MKAAVYRCPHRPAKLSALRLSKTGGANQILSKVSNQDANRIRAVSTIRSEFRLQAARYRVNAELQTLNQAANRIRRQLTIRAIMRCYVSFLSASVAQLVEQLTLNQLV